MYVLYGRSQPFHGPLPAAPFAGLCVCVRANTGWKAINVGALVSPHIAEKSGKTKLGKCARRGAAHEKRVYLKYVSLPCTEHIMIEKFYELSSARATTLDSTIASSCHPTAAAQLLCPSSRVIIHAEPSRFSTTILDAF